jgi:hypothetical protein
MLWMRITGSLDAREWDGAGIAGRAAQRQSPARESPDRRREATPVDLDTVQFSSGARDRRVIDLTEPEVRSSSTAALGTCAVRAASDDSRET